MRCVLAYVTFWAMAAGAPAGGFAELPERYDWRSGLVDGEALTDKEAVIVHRKAYEEGGDVLPPEGLEARLVREGSDGSELAAPVGVFFRPPPGQYRFWIEGPEVISPFASRLPRVQALPAGVALVGTAPTTRAVEVRVRASTGPASRTQFVSVLALGKSVEGSSTRFTLLRTLRLEHGFRTIQMPTGKTVAVLWQQGEQGVLGVSRPLTLAPGAPSALEVEPPAQDRSFLVLRARRGEEIARSVEELDERITLYRDDEALVPAEVASDADTVFAFWYDLKPGNADLEIEWRGRYLDRAVELRAGDTAAVDARLGPRPSLTIELALPSALRSKALRLEIRSEATGRLVLAEALRPGSSRRILSSVPASSLVVTLVTPYGPVSRSIDLTNGQDGYVLIEPALTTIFGVVQRDGEPHPATVRFTTIGGDPIVAETDEACRYEVVALEPLMAVTVELTGVEQAGWSDFFPAPLAETTELNFDLPGADNQVRVLDQSTREGIGGAQVVYRNRFSPAQGESGDAPEALSGPTQRAIAQIVVTGEDGVAHLPPLREGYLEVRASAEGYQSLREAVRVPVLDPSDAIALEISLVKAEGSGRLKVLLPSGEPAAGAEFQILEALQSAHPTIAGRLDAGGAASLPRGWRGGVVLVRHTAAGSVAQSRVPSEDSEEVVVQLPPRSPYPLRIRVAAGGAGDPLALERLAVATDAGYVAGGPLRWLFGPRNEVGGLISLSNLPAGPVRLVAWGAARQAEGLAGALGDLAIDVPWPWPQAVEATPIE